MAYQLKVGDKVKFRGKLNWGNCPEYFADCSPANIPLSMLKHGCLDVDTEKMEKEFGTITDIYNEYFIVKFPVKNDIYLKLGFLEKNLESVYQIYRPEGTKTMTNLFETFKSLFVSEPQKSFQKAGITDSNGQLTSEGHMIFTSYLLQKNGDDFKATIVDKIIAEQEACKK